MAPRTGTGSHTWRAVVLLLALATGCTPAVNAGVDAAPDAPLEAGADAVAVDGTVDAGPATDATAPIDATAGDAPHATDPLDPSLAPAVDTDPSHYPANVWVTSAMAKVHTDAAPGAVHWALLSAARNEFESFQVHVRATAAPVQLTVTVSDLVNAHSTDRIAAATQLTVSREAYLNITHLSDRNGRLGNTPDPLIPTVDRYAHEPRTAFPVTVPAGETRSAWIDVLVPTTTPSGYYTGTVTVRDGATMLAQLPVRLAVWNFALPSTATLRSAFDAGWDALCVQAYGSYAACSAYPGAMGDSDRAVERMHQVTTAFFLDHRVTVSDSVYAGPSGSDWTHFDATYAALFDGTAATALPGARTTSVRYQGDLTSAAQVARWVDHFGTRGWGNQLFFYHCDEPPNGCTWAQTMTEASAVHAGSASARYLLTANLANVTSHGLLDTVNIMVPILEEMDPQRGTNQRSSYDAWAARPGNTLFWYQSCDEHGTCANGAPGPATSTYPSYMVDASPMRNRLFQWLAFLNRIQGELYYDVDYCFTATDCDMGHQPWSSVYAFGGNGDGTLYYPGTVAQIGGTTPVPVSSIRLELLRDGMEDFEYLHLLSVMGDDAFARSTSAAFITNA